MTIKSHTTNVMVFYVSMICFRCFYTSMFFAHLTTTVLYLPSTLVPFGHFHLDKMKLVSYKSNGISFSSLLFCGLLLPTMLTLVFCLCWTVNQSVFFYTLAEFEGGGGAGQALPPIVACGGALQAAEIIGYVCSRYMH